MQRGVVERSSGSGLLLNGNRLQMPLTLGPLATTPPVLSVAESGRRSWGMRVGLAGAVDTVSSSTSSGIVSNGGSGGGGARNSRPGSTELSVRSPLVTVGKDPHLDDRSKAASNSGGGKGLSPSLVRARANLRSVSPVGRVARGELAAPSEKTIPVCDKGGEGRIVVDLGSRCTSGRSRPDSLNNDISADSGHRRRLSWRRSDSLNSDEVSGDSSHGGRVGRMNSKAEELEQRRAALVAASRRSCTGPPPPPPRLLSQASAISGDSGVEVLRPMLMKTLTRSKTTVAEHSASSSKSALAAAAFLANGRQGSLDDVPSVVNPLRTEEWARHPRNHQQQQSSTQQQSISNGPVAVTTTATAKTTAEPKQAQKLAINFPTYSPSFASSFTPPVQQRPLTATRLATTAAGGQESPAVVTPSPLGSSNNSSPGAVVAAAGRESSERLFSEEALPIEQPTLTEPAPQDGSGSDKTNGNGSAHSLAPPPRLVPASSLDLPHSKPATPGDGVDTPARGVVDDPPPAEMGALGVSLVCTICGTAEKEDDARVGGTGEEGGVGMVSGGDNKKAAKAGVEVARCSRCRKGCCATCFKCLPVYCRGSNVVVPGERFVQ